LCSFYYSHGPLLINTVGGSKFPKITTTPLQLTAKSISYILIPAASTIYFTGLKNCTYWLGLRHAAEIVMSGIVGIGFFIWDAHQNNNVSG